MCWILSATFLHFEQSIIFSLLSITLHQKVFSQLAEELTTFARIIKLFAEVFVEFLRKLKDTQI